MAMLLTVGDSIKQLRVCRDALNTAYEISELLGFFPKQYTAFDWIRIENLAEEGTGPRTVGIWAMYPTRWTV